MNSYRQFVADCVRVAKDGKGLPLGGLPPAPRPPLAPDAPRALFFAPHPDDESIVGALALRLLREAHFNVVNVAVTHGRKKERQAQRLVELQGACNYLGFGLQNTAPNGLERVTAETRATDPAYWTGMVKVITDLLLEHQAQAILFPHDRDWNDTHVGVHLLVVDALAQMAGGFACYTIETEFWGAMDDPNLMVEVSESDLADLVAATSFHVGEVQRNPYHLSLPAWMMDNVRRGAELVGGQGGAAPDFAFAALYRLRKWSGGRFRDVLDRGRFLSKTENPGSLFELSGSGSGRPHGSLGGQTPYERLLAKTRAGQ